MAYQKNANAVSKVTAFKNIVNTKEMVKRMTSACGSKESAFNFMASMLDLYEGDNYLQNCDPQKVLMECLKAASLKLPLVKSLGYAYVVPFKNVPTFVIGYRGLIQLALRSGQYRILNADCIYEGEKIIFDRLSGKISISGEALSDTAVGYFAYFQLINGFEKTLYMTVDEIEAYAKKYSKAYNNGPWKTDFDAMAKKTVIRQILKYGPMSTEMQEAEKMEVINAEAAAMAEVNENANKGAIIDVPANSFDMDDVVDVNTDTGEVIGSDGFDDIDEQEPDF